MSTREITLRHTCIINRLKKGPATLQQIDQYLAKESELLDYNLTTSKRTFQRDRQDIQSLYNIEIECSKSKNEYYILEKEDNALSHRMLDAFNTFNALNSGVAMSDYLEIEQYADSGAEHFHGLLHAVKNNFQITLFYQSYWTDAPTARILQPYFLKEFKNRWYLIAFDEDKQGIRTFALDRIKDLEISRKKFKPATAKKARNYFDQSFGIIANTSFETIEPVKLSFNAFQGRYIKSLPLHPSQRILKDNDQELLIQIDIFPTFDLEMQILSYGENVKVIAPPALKTLIAERLEEAFKQYQVNKNGS